MVEGAMCRRCRRVGRRARDVLLGRGSIGRCARRSRDVTARPPRCRGRGACPVVAGAHVGRRGRRGAGRVHRLVRTGRSACAAGTHRHDVRAGVSRVRVSASKHWADGGCAASSAAGAGRDHRRRSGLGRGGHVAVRRARAEDLDRRAGWRRSRRAVHGRPAGSSEWFGRHPSGSSASRRPGRSVGFCAPRPGCGATAASTTSSPAR